MKPIEELRKEFDAWVAVGGLNHSSCGPISHFSYGSKMWKEERFAEYVQNNRTFEHYAELKSKADPDCPQCRGEGYLPVFTQASSPYALQCSCVGRAKMIEIKMVAKE